MTLDDLKISEISTVIVLIIALPVIAARLAGAPLIRDLIFEASFIYVPLSVLVLLTLVQRRKLRSSST